MLSSRPIHLNIDGPQFPLKTPGRSLKNRIENAIHPGAVTVNGKGKGAANRTPFHPKSAHPERLFKGPSTSSKPQQSVHLVTRPKPLGDKTPFPNRVAQGQFHTPGPGAAQLSKLSFLLPGQQDNSELRPSSTRKHARNPRRSSFETPLNQGNHWDVSDGSIMIPEAEVEALIEEEMEQVDEVEYMAPNTLDLPYQPPFDFVLPNYKEAGATLRRLAFSAPYDDTVPPELDVKLDDLEPPTWNFISLPELEDDDPFTLARVEAKPKLAPAPSTSRVAGGSAQQPTISRPVPSTSKPISFPRPVPSKTRSLSRPGTALSAATTTASTSNARTVPRLMGSGALRKPSTLQDTRTRAGAPSAARTTPVVMATSAVHTKTSSASTRPQPVSMRSGTSATSTTTSKRPPTASSVRRVLSSTITAPLSNRTANAVGGRRLPGVKKVSDVAKPSDDGLLLKGADSFRLEEDFVFDV